MQRPDHLNPDTSPLLVTRSKEETIAILDGIIFDINTFSDELESPLSSPKTPHTPLTPSLPAEVKGQSSDVADGQKESELAKEPPKTLESPGTLKKKRFSSGIKRIGSPLLRARRKSSSSKVGDKKEEKLKEKRETFKRKMSLPEINGINLKGLDKANSVTNVSASTSMDKIYNQFTSQQPSHSSYKSQLNDHMNPCEPVNTALKLMVTLSSNKECTATLISYICLPKCEAKYER